MATYNGYSFRAADSLQKAIDRRITSASTLQEAAQVSLDELYREFEESTALARVYVTLPFQELPERDKEFARNVATGAGVEAGLQDATVSLSLLGTRGRKPAWNDRSQSREHLAIPLVSSEFVQERSMFARLLSDMGIGLEWLDTQDTEIVVRKMGRLARVFYVEDASSAVDATGRKVVPAQEFIRENDVKTVFGLTGAYANGSVLALVVFAQETISRSQVETFMPLISGIKTATLRMVSSRMIY